MSLPSSLRKIYDAVALVALVNIAGLIGLGAIMAANGTVNAEKIQSVAKILRGDDEPSTTTDEKAKTDDAAEKPAKPAPKTIEEIQTDSELLRLEEERIKTELDQRLALNNSILLQVMAQREQFHREQEEAQRQREQVAEERQATGFQKQVELFESLSPNVALPHLLAIKDPDEAARLLMAMDTRSAKKLIEAGKRGDDLRRMKTILQRLRDVAPEKSADLDQSNP